jgi:pimeloyl-ACP methyl ester carboxylesterase
MAAMMRSAPDPASDQAGFLAHGLAFARLVAGPGYPLDEVRHCELVLEEARRAYDPGGAGRQLAAMAVAGDRRARLAIVEAPTLVVHGADDPLVLPACGEDTAVSIPGADFLLVEGMGHDLPPALYGTVVEAIDRNARRGRARKAEVEAGAPDGACAG